jgi:hypothetical protein
MAVTATPKANKAVAATRCRRATPTCSATATASSRKGVFAKVPQSMDTKAGGVGFDDPSQSDYGVVDTGNSE